MDPRDVTGDPEAVICRWCHNGRRRHRGVLLCPMCDHPAQLIRANEEATPDATDTDP